jgi:hypothetical protein
VANATTSAIVVLFMLSSCRSERNRLPPVVVTGRCPDLLCC